MIAAFQSFLVIIYILLDFSLLYWVSHWYFRLPKPLNINVPLALCGLGQRLREGFGLVPQLTIQAQGPKRGESIASFGGSKAPAKPKMSS
jgi:hypothetical protein